MFDRFGVMQFLTADGTKRDHPVLAVIAQLSDALASAAAVNPSFMRTPEKAAALAELARVESQVAELRLRILADADDVAAEFAGRDVAGWLQWATRCRGEDARADLRLALALDRRYPTLGSALREGSANLAQVRVVAKTLDDLPGEVIARAEETLVGHCAEFGPRQLTQIGRRIVDIVAPEIAEEHEARALARLEEKAHRATRLSFHRVGDGTTRITGLVPDLAATRLATYLEAFTNPRRSSTPDRRPYPRRLGKAFVRFLEAVDPQRLPIHGGDATTVVITMNHESLTAELVTAGVIGADEKITAAQARRLACTAHLVPAVLGPERTGSQVLDLGRSTRLFNAAQRKALLIRDRACRAEGCDIPGTWCEAHHWIPWSHGGRTDLKDGVLLCSHHHHRAHDPACAADRLPNGDVRFNRRT
jgi:hypothetical protein